MYTVMPGSNLSGSCSLDSSVRAIVSPLPASTNTTLTTSLAVIARQYRRVGDSPRPGRWRWTAGRWSRSSSQPAEPSQPGTGWTGSEVGGRRRVVIDRQARADRATARSTGSSWPGTRLRTYDGNVEYPTSRPADATTGTAPAMQNASKLLAGGHVLPRGA